MEIIQNISNKHSRSILTDEDIKRCIEDAMQMYPLCFVPNGVHATGAVAIAHCQVDQEDPLRFFVHRDGYIIINPVIKAYKGKKIRNQEGCMSFNHTTKKGVLRNRRLHVDFGIYYINTGKQETVLDAIIEKQYAYIFQHEIDHMNGTHIFKS